MKLAIMALGLFCACSPEKRNLGFTPDGPGGSEPVCGDGICAPSELVSCPSDCAGGGSASCSADLHNVVDQNGNIIVACPSDQGCEAGTCVPACQAAAASHGAVGCDFVVATPSFVVGLLPPCFAMYLANNWPQDAMVAIERAGVSYDAATFGRVPNGSAYAAGWPPLSTGIASLDVGVLFLSSDPNAFGLGDSKTSCPVATAVDTSGGAAVYTGSTAATGGGATGVGAAFHITTSVPVSAYDILPFGGAASAAPGAELLLPTTAWGSNYVAAMPNPAAPAGAFSYPGFGQIVAATDGTTVAITPTHALPAGSGVAPAPLNMTTTYTLNAEQFIQWQDSGDMAGSVITSNQPISFTGGAATLCRASATATGAGGTCDSAHQEIPPVSALGSLYVAPPYATRRADLFPESIPYRLVGAVDGTTLTYQPAVAGAPTTLDKGQVSEFESMVPFIVESQDEMHPFYVAQYMTGCQVTSGSRSGGAQCLGDEEYVNILPPAQWLSSYVFFTDPTYATTNLVIVRKADESGTFQDVTVDCIGTLTGWQPVADDSQFEITNADLQRDGNWGTCTSGRHTATSSGAFTVMVWGLDQAASYAYPAGGNVGVINSVVVIQ